MSPPIEGFSKRCRPYCLGARGRQVFFCFTVDRNLHNLPVSLTWMVSLPPSSTNILSIFASSFPRPSYEFICVCVCARIALCMLVCVFVRHAQARCDPVHFQKTFLSHSSNTGSLCSLFFKAVLQSCVCPMVFSPSTPMLCYQRITLYLLVDRETSQGRLVHFVPE